MQYTWHPTMACQALQESDASKAKMDIIKQYIWSIIDFGTRVPLFEEHDGIMVDTNAPFEYAFSVSPRLQRYPLKQPHLMTYTDCARLLKHIRRLWYAGKPFEIYLFNEHKMVDRLMVSKSGNLINVEAMDTHDPLRLGMKAYDQWMFLKENALEKTESLFKINFLKECQNDLGWKYSKIEIVMDLISFEEAGEEAIASIQRNAWLNRTKYRIFPFEKNKILRCQTNRPFLTKCSCGMSFESIDFREASFQEIKMDFDLYIYGSKELREHLKVCQHHTVCHCCENPKKLSHIRKRTCVQKYIRQLRNGVIIKKSI